MSSQKKSNFLGSLHIRGFFIDTKSAGLFNFVVKNT